MRVGDVTVLSNPGGNAADGIGPRVSILERQLDRCAEKIVQLEEAVRGLLAKVGGDGS